MARDGQVVVIRASARRVVHGSLPEKWAKCRFNLVSWPLSIGQTSAPPGPPGWAGMPKFTIFLENFLQGTGI